jgi:transcriptional regulator with XRE-family HTH domain
VNTEEKTLLIIAQNLIRLRKAAGMSQESLAHEMGIEKFHISRFENAKANMTIRSLCRLADALNVNVLEFLKEEKPKKK